MFALTHRGVCDVAALFENARARLFTSGYVRDLTSLADAGVLHTRRYQAI
jgi:hypothetical protein